MTEYVQVITTTESKADAEAIARAVVGERLAGCAQVLGPITSSYWWEGHVETAREWLCVLKSRSDLYEKLEQAIRRHHSYEVPEILAVPVTAGSGTYLEWLSSVLQR